MLNDFDDDVLETDMGDAQDAVGSNNLLYPQEDKETRSLVYKCKRCHHRQLANSNLVFTNHVKTELVKATALINADISKDPTLPRDTTRQCYNCGFRESVYLTFPSKNEDEAMRLLFFCCNPECNAFWRQGEEDRSGNRIVREDAEEDLFGDLLNA